MTAQACASRCSQTRGCGRPSILSPCLPRRTVCQGKQQGVWHKAVARVEATIVKAAQRELASEAALPPAVAPDEARWDLAYIGRMPMVGLEDVAEALPSTLSGPLALHSFVALGSSSQPSQCLVLDFLPERPTDPATALALGTGGSTPGVLRVRRLDRWPRGRATRTRLAAPLRPVLSHQEVVGLVEEFNSSWDTALALGRNDCRHYSAALLTRLTGQPYSPSEL